QLALERGHDLALPLGGKAPAHAEVEELEWVQACGLGLEGAQQLDLGLQPKPALGERAVAVEAAEIELVDDRQHEDLERHHMHLRAARDDRQALAIGTGADELALELEDAQEVDEVGLDEAQRAEVGELVGREAQAAQMVELGV